MRHSRKSGIAAATAVMALALASGTAKAQTTVFTTDFNAGAPVQFSGITTTESVQQYAGLGPVGNQFGGLFLRNTTVSPVQATTLTLTGLQAHTSVNVNFLLAIIDSWDGINGGASPDIFNVTVGDGVITNTVFTQAFANASGTQTYVPPAGVDLAPSRPNLGFSGFGDEGYNMYLEPSLNNIAHTSSTLTVSWFASGTGYQGGDDESWAIDNVRIQLNGTAGAAGPEPGTFALLATGLAPLAAIVARRKSTKKA